jgi:hypothetical protein
VLTVEGQHACKLVVGFVAMSQSDGDLAAAPPQSEKSTASQDDAGQSCTDDGGRDSERKQFGSDLSTGKI